MFQRPTQTESWTGYQKSLPAAGSEVGFGSGLDLWKLGPRLLTQQLVLISGPLLSPPPQWKPLPPSLSAFQPLPLSSSASNELKFLRAAKALGV